MDIGLQSIIDLVSSELLTLEITLHQLFVGLCNSLHQGSTCGIQLLLNILGDRDLFLVGSGSESAALLLDDIDIADELSVFTDRDLQGADTAAELSVQLDAQLTEGSIVIIHVGNENDAGQMVLLAKLPRSAGTRLNTGLAVDDDHRSIGNTDSLFDLAYKVKVTRCIQKVDLDIALFTLEFDRNNRGGQRELTLLLLLVKVTDGVAIGHLAYAGDDSLDICQCFDDSRLAGPSMTK